MMASQPRKGHTRQDIMDSNRLKGEGGVCCLGLGSSEACVHVWGGGSDVNFCSWGEEGRRGSGSKTNTRRVVVRLTCASQVLLERVPT